MSRVPPFEEVDDHGKILFCGDPGCSSVASCWVWRPRRARAPSILI